jgi:hypothetical protein
MPRGKADIANTALRIFLQEMGAQYDLERGLTPYRGRADFAEIREFFGERCCYCGVSFGPGTKAVQDHLVPINKTSLGLHAWGNIVPACADCNSKKQQKDWRDFVVERANLDAQERHRRIREYLDDYGYAPSDNLRVVASELYEEVGEISMTLIKAKLNRLQTTS